MANEPSNRFSRSPYFWGGALLLVVLTALIYGQTGSYGFTDFDDPHYIVDNPMVNGGLSVRSVLWALTTGYYNYWHPLTWMSHMLDCECFGLDARIPHLENALLQAADAVLLFALLTVLTGKWERSLLVAAIFAVHPIHVESVAWMAERKDVLSMFFFLLTLGAYARYAQNKKTLNPQPSTLNYRLALVFFALGLMAKPMVVSLPLVLLLLDYWPLKRVTGADSHHTPSLHHSITPLLRLLWEKWPFYLLAVLTCLVNYLAMKEAHISQPGDSPLLGMRLANVPVSYVRYLVKLFWPVNLAAYYPVPNHWEVWRVAASSLVLGALTVLAVMGWKRRPWCLFGWLFFIVTLTPVSGIVPRGITAICDRYVYIPAIGIYVAVVWGIADAIRTRTGRVAISGLAMVMVGLLGGMAWRQTQVWRNPWTLWTHCLQVMPQNPVAEHNLGFYYWNSGNTNLALKYYEAAVKSDFDPFQANVNYGVALNQLGRNVEATNCFNRAVAILPRAPIARYDLGLTLMDLGDFKGAEVQCRKATELEPLNPRNWFALGRAQAGLNQHQEARESFQRALESGSHNVDVFLRLGREWNALGRFNEGIVTLNQGLAYKPRWAEAWLEMAVAYVNLRDEAQAANCYRQALDADPSNLSALNNLAWLLATSKNQEVRDGAEAVRLSERACQLTADQEPLFVGTLAAAYAEAGRFDDAVRTAGLACDLTRSAGQTNLLARNLELLAEYEKHLPHRE